MAHCIERVCRFRGRPRCEHRTHRVAPQASLNPKAERRHAGPEEGATVFNAMRRKLLGAADQGAPPDALARQRLRNPLRHDLFFVTNSDAVHATRSEQVEQRHRTMLQSLWARVQSARQSVNQWDWCVRSCSGVQIIGPPTAPRPQPRPTFTARKPLANMRLNANSYVAEKPL